MKKRTKKLLLIRTFFAPFFQNDAASWQQNFCYSDYGETFTAALERVAQLVLCFKKEQLKSACFEKAAKLFLQKAMRRDIKLGSLIFQPARERNSGAMMACCHESACSSAASADTLDSPRWRRALWIALVVNAGFFAAEVVAGVAADSAALQADALDFFGDAANYAISLAVSGMALGGRSRAAIGKGATLIAFALWVLAGTAWHAVHGTLPRAEIMGATGLAALAANGGVALMLYRFRAGDANMRSVWICSRNDAVGNLAVGLAALGVFGTGTGWPDLVVAGIMGSLGLWGGWQIVSQARAELRLPPAGRIVAAE